MVQYKQATEAGGFTPHGPLYRSFIMEYTKLSGAFGFDSKLDYGGDVTFIGPNPIAGTWYVSMREYAITLSVTDTAGNSVFCTLDNDDYSLSGLDASILIKQFFFILRMSVQNGNRLPNAKGSTINGRKVLMLWINKKDAK
jgi:hypothetical protein